MKNKSNFSMQEIFFFLILIGISVAFFKLLVPFLTDIFLTIILVLLFKKPHSYILRKFKGKKSLAAGTTLLLVSFIVVIPLIFIGIMVSDEAAENIIFLKEKWPVIQEQITQENIHKYLDKIPLIGKHIEDLHIGDFKEKIEELVGVVSEFILYIVQNTILNLSYLLIHSFIVLFLMYYLLLDGSKLINRIQYLIPLRDEDEKELFTNLEKVTDAIIINTFMIGAIEGTYGGILFAVLGVQSPVFWGVLMAALSVIPLVGANSILAPMGVFQLIIGNYTAGTIILVLGVGAVLINQNIIRPRLDGNKSGMHTAIVFLASMGGLMWLGIIGFLAGPLIAALFLTIWNQFGIKYQKRLEQFNKGD